MSAAETREALAKAASTVQDINAHPYYVQGTDPGHTYVRRERRAWPNKFGAVIRWNVVVILPQDLADAERYLEEREEDLLAALAPLFTIQEVVLQQLNITGVGNLPAAFFNGSREE